MNNQVLKDSLYGLLTIFFLNVFLAISLFLLSRGLLHLAAAIEPLTGGSLPILLSYISLFVLALPSVYIGITQLFYGIPLCFKWWFKRNKPNRVYGAIVGMILTQVISMKIIEIFWLWYVRGM